MIGAILGAAPLGVSGDVWFAISCVSAGILSITGNGGNVVCMLASSRRSAFSGAAGADAAAGAAESDKAPVDVSLSVRVEADEDEAALTPARPLTAPSPALCSRAENVDAQPAASPRLPPASPNSVMTQT
jgi:hypothetical protein